MDLERQVLWIIPNGDYEDKGLVDGDPILYEYKLGSKDHKELGQDFCRRYGLTGYSIGGNHTDWGKYFAKLGFAVFFNSGQKADGKYYGQWYLPNDLTQWQISFLENTRKLFENEYHRQATFFRVFVLPEENENYAYKLTEGLRDLRTEEMIKGTKKEDVDGINTFYQEIERQKEKLKQKRR